LIFAANCSAADAIFGLLPRLFHRRPRRTVRPLLSPI
jgi:hypothetical protein